jgi:hypothetical protein
VGHRSPLSFLASTRWPVTATTAAVPELLFECEGEFEIEYEELFPQMGMTPRKAGFFSAVLELSIKSNSLISSNLYSYHLAWHPICLIGEYP